MIVVSGVGEGVGGTFPELSEGKRLKYVGVCDWEVLQDEVLH